MYLIFKQKEKNELLEKFDEIQDKNFSLKAKGDTDTRRIERINK